MRLIDEDSSGTIDRFEWVSYLSGPEGGQFSFELKALFDINDLNHDGVVTIDEFQNIFLSTFNTEILLKSEKGRPVAEMVVKALAMEIFASLDEDGCE